jgi:hypothetical protein
MNKTSNNVYLRASLITLILLSMLFSTFHLQVQSANAQNSTDSTGILSPISQQQQQQLAANGTSFDGFIKQRIAAMDAAKIPVNYTAFDPPRLFKVVNVCVSPLGKAFAQTVCDFVTSTVYEMCQAIPDQLSYVCMMPAINSYLKDRNIVDGQTDRLAWQFALHREEITANPFEGISNSTETITNTTTTGQKQIGGGATISTKKNDSISFKTTLQSPSYPGSNTFDIPPKSNFTFGSRSPLCPTNDCKQRLIGATYNTYNPESPSVQGTLKIENKTTSTAYIIKYSMIPFSGDFHVTGIEENRKTGHSTTEFSGDFGLGGGTSTLFATTGSEFKYSVIGTFDNTTKVLTFEGQRSTS